MKNRIVYMGITGLFVVEILAIASHAHQLERAPVFFWVLAGFAAFRLARTISFNGVAEWLRAPFCEVKPDGSGAGDNVEAKNGNPIGELIACPICTGTHTALVIVAAYAWLPALGLALAAGLGLAGVSEVIHWTMEAAEWRAHTAREECGAMVRAREQANPRRWREWNANIEAEKKLGQAPGLPVNMERF